jgi:glucans biosynthesis protein
LDRRTFLAGSAAALSFLGTPWSLRATAADTPFDGHMVREHARELAAQPYKAPDDPLPPALKDLDYNAYRAIRFRPERALWEGEDLPFKIQFFHRGFIYADRVQIHEVTEGRARPISYSRDMFSFGAQKEPPADANLGFAGFRMHAPINTPDYHDEVGVFLGASYFRAVAKGQVYGLSARGLSLRTGDPKGEEFPAFRSFWIEKPAKGAHALVVHALLDSPSATAAYRFTIRPGAATVYDVEMALYPRVEIREPGIGSLTSMFFFAPNDRVGVDDFRPAVHDSDGLAIRNGRGEELWRPLCNPQDLQISIFSDVNPRGFGLMQRQRDFGAYQDLESNFEKRPSAWVEPIGDWGEGAVHLVEIPTKAEIHDNIVAFWRPRAPLLPKRAYNYTHRLHWGWGKADPRRLAHISATRVGAGSGDNRRFVLDIHGEHDFSNPETFRADVSAGKGEIRNLVLQGNPETGGLRLAFELNPGRETLIELRAQVSRQNEPVSETWLYRWTP